MYSFEVSVSSFPHLGPLSPVFLPASRFCVSLLIDELGNPNVQAHETSLPHQKNWFQIDAPRHFFIFYIKSLKILSEKSDLKLYFLLYNSTFFQFWGSEDYRRGISLISNNSYNINPSNSIFTSKEIRKFKKDSKRLNRKNRGDQVIVCFKKKLGFNSDK